jgi:hypothetical protein
MKAGAGSTLTLEGTTENASTGVIAASGAGSLVQLLNATVVGGTLKTTSGGVIEVVGTSTFDGSKPGAPLTNTGSVAVAVTLDLIGTIVNKGALNATDPNTLLLIGAGGAALEGGGKITLADSSGNIIKGVAATDTLVNIDNRISGAGAIGNGQMTLVNQAKGVIDATSVNNALVLNTGTNVITNAGVLEATGGPSCFLFIDSKVANAGTIEATNGSEVGILSPVTNTATGVIEAIGTGSIVEINNTIYGGTLKTAMGGTIGLAGTLNGFTPAAPITITGSTFTKAGAQATLLGTIINNGSMALAAGGVTTTFTIGTGGAAFEGTGKIKLSDESANVIEGAAAADTLTNVSNVISGAGSIGNGQMTLVNQTKGVIDATGKTNALVLDTGANVITNAGVLEATGGGTLAIDSKVANRGGVIEAIGTGSVVAVNGKTITGGTLKTAMGGSFAGSATLDGSTPGAPVTIVGTFAVADGESSALLGTIVNNGSIALNAAGGGAGLFIGDGGALLQGRGKITLSDNAGNFIEGTDASFALTNVSNIISGAGDIGEGHMTLVNGAKGVINATGKNNALILETGGNAITNSGLIETAVGAKGLTINSALVNNGKLLAAGGDLLINAAVSGNGSATINRGGEIEFGSTLTDIMQNVTFAAAGTGNATLRFDATASSVPSLIYTGVISGFSSTADRIDLAGLSFQSNTVATTQLQGANTILTITEGTNTVSLTLAGNHTMDKFVVSDDGTGGTLVVDPPAAKPDLSHLVHTIASFGMPSGLSAALGHTPLAGGWNEASMLAVAAPHH